MKAPHPDIHRELKNLGGDSVESSADADSINLNAAQVPQYTPSFKRVLVHLSWEKYRDLVHDRVGKYA